MSESLKSKTVSGVLWSAIERFSLQGVQFIINILMARLLLPSDYGMIGMLAVFLQISQTFIDSGFSDALVQKKDRTETDLSTVFSENSHFSGLFSRKLLRAAEAGKKGRKTRSSSGRKIPVFFRNPRGKTCKKNSGMV